jgi:hypothetical protein
VEPIIGLYGAFTDLGPLERHVVDSSGDHTVAQTRAAVKRATVPADSPSDFRSRPVATE